MGDDKKPAEPKKDDKKPATPAKPASSNNWDLNKKTGPNNLSAMESWDAYITMEQLKVDEKAKLSFSKECINASWNKFFTPIIFGKLGDKTRDMPDFKPFFGALAWLNDNLANGTAQGVYKLMMGASWFDKVKASVKKTTAKVKIGLKNTGAAITAGAKKIGAEVKKGAKVVADGAKKAAASIKGGLKVNVKAPKVSVKAGAKAAPKAKVSVKAGAKATPKAKVGVKVGAKTRRLQEKKDAKSETSSGFLPALPTDNKPAEKPAAKPAADANADTEMEVSKEGLPVSEYSGDVDVPKELTGDSDQTAPKTANLVKLCFMFLAALSMM